MGIGWVQELVSRLTKTPLTTFDSSTNGTLDSSNITFPLDQPIYVDASHDTVISQSESYLRSLGLLTLIRLSLLPVIVALNFTTMAANGPLPIDRIPEYQVRHSSTFQPRRLLTILQTYHVHNIAPFATNLVGQVLSCPASSTSGNSTTAGDKVTYIRFLLNDGAVPLTGISHCETPDPNGLCLLDNFVQGMQERIAEVDFLYDCYGNYTAPPITSDPIIDGRQPQ